MTSQDILSAGIVAFPLFFAALWVAICFIIAATGGWRTLARSYTAPGARSSEGEHFRMASATIGKGLMPANYKGCLVITFGRAGIYMVPWIIFRLFHPPLLIPWRAVKSAGAEKFWWRTCAVIEIDGFDGRIRLYGRAGEAAVSAFAKFRP